MTKRDDFHPGGRVARPHTALTRRAWQLVPVGIRRRVARYRRARRLEPWDPGFDFTPPRPPPGLVAAEPDFVGIGAAKAGTTWWYGLLVQHPRIVHTPNTNKERNFLREELVSREPTAADSARYAGWFARPPGMLAGEWTPGYYAHCFMGPALARLAPDAKLLMLVRDPVERFISERAMALAMGRPFGDGEESWVERGRYAQWLGMLEPHVGSERLLVLQYERCVQQPEVELARTFEFLGVDPVEIENLREPVNARADKVPLSADRRRTLTDLYRPDVERLVAAHPEIDLDLWPNFGSG